MARRESSIAVWLRERALENRLATVALRSKKIWNCSILCGVSDSWSIGFVGHHGLLGLLGLLGSLGLLAGLLGARA